MMDDRKEPLDFSLFQRELDVAFHSRKDVYPAGSPEHAELLQFIPRLHRLRQQQRKGESNAGNSVVDDERRGRAQALGIPASYDPRYRVSCTLALVDKEGYRNAVKSLERRLKNMPHSPPGWNASEIVEEYRCLLPWYEDFSQKRQLSRVRKLLADKALLPMAPYEEAIVQAVRNHQAVVIAGDTGCGKSTQVPQFLIKGGFKRIVCTQPRRISAMSLCRRVAHETLNVHGSDVAYKIRFTSTMTEGSKIIFMTEGILLRMMATDPLLSAFDVIIIDEVHERHLNTDFLLALLRAVLLQRSDLRVVLMSATISFQTYSAYFGGAPVIQVPGRLYPIQLEYISPEEKESKQGGPPESLIGRSKRPALDRGVAVHHSKAPTKTKERCQDSIDPKPYLKLIQRLDSEIPASQRGDMLVFVSGMADIVALSDGLRPYAMESRRWIILPLHSSLAVEEQDKVFDASPDGVRKCIISTNIAETSITIDGVRFVVDSGRAKEMMHDVASGAGSLQEGWISRASADQRKGRAGRTGPGKCFRMYSEAEFNDFRPFSLPEVQRIRLESVVLQIKALAGNSLDPRCFGFIDPPPEDGLEAAIINLKQVGALTQREELTPLGSVLCLLPVDIHVGKLLVLASLLQVVEPVLTIAAAISVQSPFSRLSEDDEQTRSYRYPLLSADGDAFTLMRIFEEWLRVKATGQASSLPNLGAQGSRDTPRHPPMDREKQGNIRISSAKWCKRAGLEEQRLYEMAKLRSQFSELMSDFGLTRLVGVSQGTMASTAAGTSLSRKRRGGSHHLKSGVLHAAKKRLREMQNDRDRERGKKVLKMEHGKDTSDTESEENSASSAEDMHDLDLRVSVDVANMHRLSTVPMTRPDILLVKWILSTSLYPRVAVADDMNKQRRNQDCKFHTSISPDLVVHPGSCLAGSVSELSSQEVLLYTQLLETRRQYLCGITPVFGLPSLLLAASSIDTDQNASRWVIDGWLLLRLFDQSGPKILEIVASIRSRVSLLLHQRLLLSRAPNLESVAVVDDSVSLYPWQAAASGDEGMHQRLLEMPDVTRMSMVHLAASCAQSLASLSESSRAQTLSSTEVSHTIGPKVIGAASDAISAARETAIWWGVQSDALHSLTDENILAKDIALMMEAPIQYSMERLSGGQKTTVLYRLSSNAASTGAVDADIKGVPLRRLGVQLAPWLRWNSLMSFDSGLAAHSLQPALRQHWSCPGCGYKTIGSYEDITSHIANCNQAQASGQEACDKMGYAPGISSTDAFQKGASALVDSKLAGYWKSKKIVWSRRQTAKTELVLSGELSEKQDDSNLPAKTSQKPVAIQSEPPVQVSCHFECAICGFVGDLTPVQALHHRRGHDS